MADAYRVIPLTKGFVAIISTEDFRRVNRYKWYTHTSAGSKRKPGRPYARACINGRKVYLHRFILNPAESMQVDHRNHCTLDDRRENLEEVDHKTNQRRKRKCNSIKRTYK